MALVQGISMDPYKKHVVAFLCSFASAVGGKIIAEGWKHGDRRRFELGAPAQGFCLHARRLFQRPAPFVLERLLLRRAVCKGDCIVGEGLRSLVIQVQRRKREMTREEPERIFRKNRTLDHLVVLENEALSARHQTEFFPEDGEPSVPAFSKASLEDIATASFKGPCFQLQSTLAKLAMEREPEELYDPVVVVDDCDFWERLR